MSGFRKSTDLEISKGSAPFKYDILKGNNLIKIYLNRLLIVMIIYYVITLDIAEKNIK